MGTILIVGGHTGIGLEAAKRLLAQSPVNLVLAGRNLERVNDAAKMLRQHTQARVSTVLLDLNSLDSVRSAATTIHTMLEDGSIDSLQSILLNAGIQPRGSLTYSKEGYEETFATNDLGHFLLLNLLLDDMDDDGRIIFTASGTHDPNTMDGKMVGTAVEPDVEMLAYQGKNGTKAISAGKRYTTSKLVTMLYAYELDRKLRAANSTIQSIAFDPGYIPETGLGRSAPKPLVALSRTAPMKRLVKLLGVTLGSVAASGDALAKLAVDPYYARSSGSYYQSNDGKIISPRSSVASYDEVKAKKAWEDSIRLARMQPNEIPARLRT